MDFDSAFTLCTLKCVNGFETLPIVETNLFYDFGEEHDSWFELPIFVVDVVSENAPADFALMPPAPVALTSLGADV